MATYDELDSLIAKLKRSAITAWMHQRKWREIHGNYERLIAESKNTVSLPDGNGEGGGVWIELILPGLGVYNAGSHEVDDTYSRGFDQIRAEIDDLLRPWRALPDPADVTTVVKDCRAAESALARSPRTVEGKVIAAGPIAGHLSSVSEILDDMKGEAMDKLKYDFLAHLTATVDNFRALAEVRGSAVQAQQKMWETTRSHVARIVDDARQAMDEISQDSSLSWDMVFKVIGVAIEGASAFATGGVSGALSLGQLGVRLLGDHLGASKEKSESATPQSYEEAIAALARMLQTLNEQIIIVEEGVEDVLAENVELIRGNPRSYDLEASAVGSGDNSIKYDVAQIRGVAGELLPAVAGELELAAAASLDCSTFASVYRDASIGVGANGPSQRLAEFNWLSYELAKELAWEVTNVAENLRLALRVIVDQESEFKAQLDGLTRTIKAGSPYDPWDSDRPSWGSPVLPMPYRPRMNDSAPSQ